jgi:hypothetical protein
MGKSIIAPVEPNVLVGIGKHSLRKLLDEAYETPEGEQTLMDSLGKHHWPPRYRRVSICTEEEVGTFEEYLEWIQERI